MNVSSVFPSFPSITFHFKIYCTGVHSSCQHSAERHSLSSASSSLLVLFNNLYLNIRSSVFARQHILSRAGFHQEFLTSSRRTQKRIKMKNPCSELTIENNQLNTTLDMTSPEVFRGIAKIQPRPSKTETVKHLRTLDLMLFRTVELTVFRPQVIARMMKIYPTKLRTKKKDTGARKEV